MQATGMVNDHLTGCFRHKQCAKCRPLAPREVSVHESAISSDLLACIIPLCMTAADILVEQLQLADLLLAEGDRMLSPQDCRDATVASSERSIKC